jgi:hypothetical protein
MGIRLIVVDLRACFNQADLRTHRSYYPMSQEIFSSELNKDIICEANGCSAKATTNIAVKVGQQGVISLHLCKGCVNKFREEEPK